MALRLAAAAALSGALLLSSPLAAANAAKDSAPQTLFAGSTPMGSTAWTADGTNSVTVDVSTAHLGLDAAPTYMTRVVHRTSALQGVDGVDTLANVTGTALVRAPSATGFKMRLRYSEAAGKNLTATTAKVGDWRVLWVAASHKHAGMDVDVRPNSTPALASLVKLLVEEDPFVVRSLFVPGEYQPMLRNVPPPKLPRAKAKSSADGAGGAGDKSSSSGSPSNEDAAKGGGGAPSDS